MSWRDNIETVEPSWRDKIETVEPSWKDSIETVDESTFDQFTRGVTTPFTGEDKQYKAAEPAAREYMKQEGYDPDSWGDRLQTAAEGMVDVVSGGNVAEIKSYIKSLSSDIPRKELEEMYEAAYLIKKEEQPIEANIGELGGAVGASLGAGLVGGPMAAAAVGAGLSGAVGYERTEEGKVAESLGRGLSESVITGTVLGAASKVLGSAIKGVKGFKNEKQIKKVLEAEGLGSEQADAIAKKATLYKKQYDDELKSIDRLTTKQTEEFERVILGGQSVDKYRYADLDSALDQYRDMLAKRTSMLEEAALPKEKVGGLDVRIQGAEDRLRRKITEGVDSKELKDALGEVYATKKAQGASSAEMDKALQNVYRQHTGGFDREIEKAKQTLNTLKKKRQETLEEVKTNREHVTNWAIKLMDAQYVGNMADRRYGTDLMLSLNNTSRSLTGGLHEAKALKQKAQALIDKFNIEDLKSSEELIDLVEKGKGPKEITDLMEHFRSEANKLYGAEVIPKRANYIPHYTKRTPEMIAILRHEVKKTTGLDPKDVEIDQIGAIKKNKELWNSLKYLNGFVGKKDHLEDAHTLTAFVKELADGDKAKKILDLSASSIHERIALEVPDLIREKDLGRLLGSWIDSTTMDAALRKDIRKIKATAEALKSVDPVMSQYFNGYVADLAGVTRGFHGIRKKGWNEYATKLLQKSMELREGGHTTLANAAEAASALPQLGQFSQAQLYNYFLGNRPDAIVRNLTQPFVVTIPSISVNPVYATKLAARNIHRSVSGMAGQFFNPKSFKELEAKGWLPPDPTPGQFQALSHGIHKSGAYKKAGRKLLEWTNNLSMLAYQQSDIANRIVTLGMGKDLTKDILEGNKTALGYLQNLPPAYRKKAKEALASGDKETLEDTVLDHLMATTQFNYNKASMSAYGREMGPMFAQFTKWPTAIGADIYDGLEADKFAMQRGKTKLPVNTAKKAVKYFGPWLALTTAGHFIQEDQSPEQRVLLGKDITGAAPIKSVTPLLDDPARSIFSAPVMSALADAHTLLGLVPGMTWYRAYTERVRPFMGETPKKPAKHFTEDILGVE